MLKFDWLLIENMKIEKIKNQIKQKIKKQIPIDLKEKSTKGIKSKQYELFNNFLLKDNSNIVKYVKDSIKNSINKNFNKNYTLKLISAWTILGKENGYHTMHKHNDKEKNHISSILYLNVPKKFSGNFYCVFKKNDEINYFDHVPKNGQLIIFPVWIFHGTYPQGKGSRHTLNLDFEITEEKN
jgi:hypothetical protein